MITVNKANPTAAEERTSLVNASDGAGLNFDGSAGYIDIASPPDLGTKASFELIISAETASQTAYIFDFGSGGRTILSVNSGSLRFYSGGWSDFSVSTLDDLKVHHLCVTVDGTAAVLYDNGNQVATATLAASLNADSATDLKIGSHNGGSSDFFNGTIYRARFYNRTLSADDVRTAFERADVPVADQYGENNLVDAAASAFTIGSGASTYSWVAYTGNTIANVSNDLTITYGGNSNGAYNYFRDSSDLNQNLIVGKKYRLRIRAKYAGGAAGVAVQVYDGSASTVADSALTTSFADYTVEFTAQSTTGAFVYLSSLKSSNVVTIDTWQLDEIGCVSDYQTQWANPTQSLTVQDASGNADGTCSSSGVSQVQPVVQLNSTAARIGTSAATPADGELLVSAKIGINVDPSDPLHIDGDGDADILLTRTTANTDGTLGRIFFGGNDHDKYLASVEAYHDGAVDSAALKFTTEAAGTSDRPARLTIDSLGHVLVGTTALDANLGAKKMQLEGSASTSAGPEMLLHNPAQGGGAASMLTFGGKASGTEGYTAAIKATNTGTLTIGTAHASGGFSEPAADLTISSTGQALFSGSKVTVNTDGTVDWGNAADAGRLTWDTNDAKIRGVAGKNLKLGANNTDYVTINTSGLASFSNGVTVSGGVTSLGSFTNLDISSGAITITSSTHKVDTEGGAATDDLDTINGGTDGSILVIQSNNNDRDVTAKDGTGNLQLAGNFELNHSSRKLTLIKSGSVWYELSRSSNI